MVVPLNYVLIMIWQERRKKQLAPGQPSAKTGTDRRGDSSILKNGKLGQFWWCFKATINGDAGHFPTPRNGHFPTPRFGHFPTPRNGQTPRFGHSPKKRSFFNTTP